MDKFFLDPDFSGIVLSVSSLNLMLTIDLLCVAFIIFRYVPCTPDLSNTFLMKVCCVFLKDFFNI